MAWRKITDADVLVKMSRAELDGIKDRSESGDPLPGAIRMVTERVRGSVAAHPANTMGAEGTIPERLMDAAVSLLVVDLYSTTAGLLIDLSDTRKDAAKNAARMLERVADGKFAVELPGTAGVSNEDAKSDSAELVTQSSNPLRRDDLAGL